MLSRFGFALQPDDGLAGIYGKKNPFGFYFLLQNRRSRLQPRKVVERNLSGGEAGAGFANRRLGVGVKPMVHFTVPVGEGNTTAAVVIGCRHVVPDILRHVFAKERVVDAVGMFVHEQPGVGGARLDKFSGFKEFTIRGLAKTGVPPGMVVIANITIHGNTSIARSNLAVNSVRRAFVDADIFRVRAERAGGQDLVVRVCPEGRSGIPIQPPGAPAGKIVGRAAPVDDNIIGVVARILKPGITKLFDVVQTESGPSFLLRLA